MSGAGPDVVVLTGFLGSGKTTLLREFLLTEAAAETAVIVNEAGEIGLDGVILREAGGDVAMTMLANGCICCEAGTDLTLTVDALLAAPRPAPALPLRRIVIETSGLSKPGPVLRQLAPLAAHRLRVAVAATYDATRGHEMDGFEEAAAQWAGAHRIVVTKTDAVPPGHASEAEARARAINPLAEIIAAPDRATAARLSLTSAPASAVAPPNLAGEYREGLHPRITTFCLRQSGDIAHRQLAAWLDNLAGALGDRLLRLKGLVRVEGHERPLLVQSVGTVFSAPRLLGGNTVADELFLAIIARDVSASEIDAVPPPINLTLPRVGPLGRRRTPRARLRRAEAL